MIIGIPKEIKEDEYRVALTPQGAEVLVKAGHKVIIEKSAGEGSGFSDDDYKNAGAEIIDNPAEIWRQSEMIVKVKEPQKSEFEFLRPDLILFTYLHLAAFPELTQKLLEKNATAIDYATVELEDGSLPLLKPMSEIAGKLAAQKGAQYLEKIFGGNGILLGGTEKVPPANVVVFGAGTVGGNAAEIVLGMGANITLIDKNSEKLEALKTKFQFFGERLTTLLPSNQNLETILSEADLLVGAVLVPGAKAPKVVTEEQVKMMKKGSVIVDVAIDQGGCVETSRPTTHHEPIFIKHGVIHYCVANMPGIVPKTSTLALTEETMPYVSQLAGKGLEKAIEENPALAKGVNVRKGMIIHPKLKEVL